MNETRYPMWDLMRVGELLGILQHVTDKDRADEVYECIRELQGVLDDLYLTDSAEWVEDWFAAALEDLEEKLTVDPDVILRGWTEDLRDIAKDLTPIVRDEAYQRSVFVVPKDTHLDVEQLVDEPLAVLCPNATPQFDIPLFAEEDLKEAAECYAIGRSAATIIFALRATEALLREFHTQVTNSSPKSKAYWASLARDLGSSSLSCEYALQRRLDSLRKRRNDAMHPGPRDSKDWNDRAARKVMRDCGKVVVAMWRDHARRGQSEESVS